MRLKFRKVPALLLSAAMAVTPMTGAWAADLDSNALTWVEGKSWLEFTDFDETEHTANVRYYLYDIEGNEKEFIDAADFVGTVDATCTVDSIDLFKYNVFVADENVANFESKDDADFGHYGEALGHDWDSEYVHYSYPVSCEEDGYTEYWHKCKRCDLDEFVRYEVTETKGHDWVLTGYTDWYNVVATDEQIKAGLIPDADGKWEEENDPSHPLHDRPELPSGFNLLYTCDICGKTKKEEHPHDPYALLEGAPEIRVETIDNLYYTVTENGTVVLAAYPQSMNDVEQIEGKYTGKVLNNATAILVDKNGYFADKYLVDCEKDGSYQIVTYAKNADGSWMYDARGERVIARVLDTVKVPAEHKMGTAYVDKIQTISATDDNPRLAFEYNDKGEIVVVKALTCLDGWYTTRKDCLNPNCKHHEDETLTAAGDARLHQFPKWDQKLQDNVVINGTDQEIDKAYLVLDTQNCYNWGVQTYERHCTLCGETDSKKIDNSKLEKTEAAHKFGTPVFVDWITEPTCTKPGVYKAEEFCVNQWYDENGNTYTCDHKHETQVIARALEHDPISAAEWSGNVVVDDKGQMLEEFTNYKTADYLGYDADAYRFAKAELVVKCTRCPEEIRRVQINAIKVVAIEKENETSCAPGHITLQAVYEINGKKMTSEKEFLYYSDIDSYRGKTDHAWSAPVTTVEKEATCTEDGKKVTKKVCELCGTEQIISEEVIPAKGHVAGETVEEDGQLVTYCKVCGEPYITVPVEPEADPVADFVARMYDVVLNRKGDEEGAAYWTQRLKDGNQSGAGLAADFFTGKEYIGRNKSDSEYLNDLYTAIMGRNADAAGKAYWQGRLNMGYSRNSVLESFLGSPEFRGICDEYGIKVGSYKSNEASDVQLKNVTAFVTRLYETCMGRPADPTGLDYWVKRLVNGQATGTDAVVYFCNSAEFAAKNLSDSEFVTVLYTAVMGRNAEESGVNYWAGQLAKGATRTSVVESFAKSAEFGRICESYGITR